MDSKIISGPVVQTDIMDGHEMAQYLKISYWVLMRLARESQIPSFRCGGKVLFRKHTIDKFIEDQENNCCRTDQELG